MLQKYTSVVLQAISKAFFFLQWHFSSRNREITLVYFGAIVFCNNCRNWKIFQWLIAFSCLWSSLQLPIYMVGGGDDLCCNAEVWLEHSWQLWGVVSQACFNKMLILNDLQLNFGVKLISQSLIIFTRFTWQKEGIFMYVFIYTHLE